MIKSFQTPLSIEIFILDPKSDSIAVLPIKIKILGSIIEICFLRKFEYLLISDGSGERLLTENFYQEAPSWSPNGRVLIFYRETKTDEKGEGFSAKLWSIDLTGYNERLVDTETDASDPSWSSLLSN